jgi:hypothetical protein
MRILNDGDGGFDKPPGGMPGGDAEEAEAPSGAETTPSVETSAHEPAESPELESDGAEPAKEKGKLLSKFELARAKKERDRVKEDGRFQKAQAKAAEEAQARYAAEQRALQLEAQVRQAQEQARINSNPMLREAVNLINQRETPENVEAEAKRLRETGDEEGAKAGFEIARLMRLEIGDRKLAQETESQRASEGQWKQVQFGTPEFDASAMLLKPNTEDFDQCWGLCERNVVARDEASQDPFERQCAKEYRDQNSPLGQRLNFFFRQTGMGREFGKKAVGFIPGYEIVKAYYRVDILNAKLAKLEAENQRLRGHTSIGASAPTSENGVNGSSRYNGNAQASRDDARAFSSLSLEEQRRFLRSREVD